MQMAATNKACSPVNVRIPRRLQRLTSLRIDLVWQWLIVGGGAAHSQHSVSETKIELPHHLV